MNNYMYLSNQNWYYSSIMCSHFKILYSVYFVMEKKICKNSRKMKNFKKWISFLNYKLSWTYLKKAWIYSVFKSEWKHLPSVLLHGCVCVKTMSFSVPLEALVNVLIICNGCSVNPPQGMKEVV